MEHQHCFREEKYDAGNQHTGADHSRPDEAEVVVPVNDGENEASEEEDRASPATKARGDVARCLERGALKFLNRPAR